MQNYVQFKIMQKSKTGHFAILRNCKNIVVCGIKD